MVFKDNKTEQIKWREKKIMFTFFLLFGDTRV